ncbi:hypothetical protein WJS89_10520 [Sphingomicrobium sp. XHP0235]|uniref:phage tail fiber protein n=1 Tax=Sphingomicrobium aquimarinum TaxID=3133971 RepID=UPI0031FE8E78
MSATNAFEDEILALILNGTAIPSLSGVTSFWLSLHTANPGETGTQATSETNYTGYTRIEIERSDSAITVSSGGTNVSQITFPQCTGELQTLTHVGIGTSETGAGTLLLSGELTEQIQLQNNMTPVIEAGNLDFTCD